MFKKAFIVSGMCMSLLALNTHAATLGKPKSVTLNTSQVNSLTAAPVTKEIKLLDIQLTAQEKNVLRSYTPSVNSEMNLNSKLPSKIQLGMNNTPVLDQGQHGTCVTFATSGAIDAVLGNGDNVSQLCSLELGSTLEKNSYYPSGWDGSWGWMVMDQYTRFGYVSMKDQTSKGCAGVKKYPTNNESDNGVNMSLREFSGMSHNVGDDFYVNHFMNFNQRFSGNFSNEAIDHVVTEIKESLAAGNRVTFGTILIIPQTRSCTVGACATHNAKSDTWALTSELNDPNAGQGGHEMIITGYDDDATATDHDGNVHKGLFTLRNSWGANVADKGDFYMTYDYFKKYAGEATALVS